MRIQTAIDKHWQFLEKLLYGLVLIGLIVGAMLMGGRFTYEQNYQQVELSVHYEDLVEESRLSGASIEELLRGYQEAGATSLLVKEYNVNTLKDQTVMTSGLELYWDGLPAYPKLSYMLLADSALADSVRLNLALRNHLQDEFKLGAMTYLGTDLPLSTLWSMQAHELSEVFSVGMGWPLEDMKLAEKLGFYLQLQIRDWETPVENDITRYFTQFSELEQISLFLFNSSDLFGYSKDPGNRVLFPAIAEEMSRNGAYLGQVEFFNQKGFEQLAKSMQERVVRVHSIAENEIGTLSQTAAVERFMLAVKDRNMRSLFVRAYYSGTEDSHTDNVRYVSEIVKGLQNKGFELDRAEQMANLYVPTWAIFILSVGALAAAVLLSHYLKLAWLGLPIGILGILMALVLIGMQEYIWLQKISGLLSACVFPLLGFSLVMEGHKDPRGPKLSVLGLMLMSAVTLIGAVYVVGLLRERAFMLGLELFTGVKVAMSLPLAGVLIYYFCRRNKDELISLWKGLVNRPLTIKILLIGGAAAAILGVYLLRTGNTGLLPTNVEMVFRRVLEQVTMARPRTKEFLIGHPLMLLGLSYGFRLKTLPLFLLGMIGQVSLLNTFTHLHTPLSISMLRSGYGLFLGTIFGLMLLMVVHTLYNRWKR